MPALLVASGDVSCLSVFSLLSAKWVSLYFTPSMEDPSRRSTEAGVNGGEGWGLRAGGDGRELSKWPRAVIKVHQKAWKM